MSVFSALSGGVQSLGYIAIAFPFVLLTVVFIHEMGHFLVARWCGVSVKAFSLGFGKEIWGFTDRKGTRWRLAWIPLGGYVKFMDDDNPASMPGARPVGPDGQPLPLDPGSFHGKSLAQKAAVVVAGPAANFLSSILIFAALFAVVGYAVVLPRIGSVVPNSPAERAGFQPGDVIREINGAPVSTFDDIIREVSGSADRELGVQVDRGGVPTVLHVTPQVTEVRSPISGKSKRATIGIVPAQGSEGVEVKRVNPIQAIGLGADRTWFIISSTMQYLGGVVAGHQKADQLGGPIRIAVVAGEVAKLGLTELLAFTAMISVSIGLINLFPIPLLDGGHLMFYAIEAVMRRPLSERTMEIGFRIGMAVVLALMIFATFNDLPWTFQRLMGN